MERVEKSIIVDCPLQTVYNQWTQFENFPRFMEGVKRVTQLDDKRLHWEAEIGGKHKEWNARITEQIPDLRIAWQNEAGEDTSGIVTFQPDGPDRTRVNLQLFYDPKGFVESAGDAIGVVYTAWRVILSASKNSSNSAGAKPVHGAARSEILLEAQQEVVI